MWKHNDKQMLSFLEREALEGEAIRGSKHACAIVHKNKLLAVGTNKLKTHPIMLKYGKNEKAIFLHAEMDAIVRVINLHGADILSECDLYVMRLTQGNKVGNSKPCSGCQRAIEAFNIKKVYHT